MRDRKKDLEAIGRTILEFIHSTNSVGAIEKMAAALRNIYGASEFYRSPLHSPGLELCPDETFGEREGTNTNP